MYLSIVKTVLALLLVVGVVVSHHSSYKYRRIPSRSYGGNYGNYRRPYGDSSVSRLIGKPAKVVKVVTVTRVPHRGHLHGVRPTSQTGFGVNNVPVTSFERPSSAEVGIAPGSPSGAGGTPHNLPGINGVPNSPTSFGGVAGSPTGVSGFSNPNIGVVPSLPDTPGFTGVSGSGIPQIAGSPSVPQGITQPGSSRPGSCPPVRSSCTTFRTTPPSCTTDDTCLLNQRCCFDSCVQRNICKSII